jgi:co-chaperonin GroES (HSP10)
MYSKSGTGYVMVITPAMFNVDSGRIGVDGQPIIIDIVFDPMKYVLNYGEVFKLPVDMGGKTSPISQKSVGVPGYGPIRRTTQEEISFDIYAIGGVYEYKFVSDIAPEVEAGDRIYFKKRTLNSPANQMGVLLDPKTKKPAKYIYKVPYENIFCAVKKDGRIVPIGGWVLLSPIWEDWEDTYRKTYYDFKDKHGEPMPRPKNEWIKLKHAPETDNQRAKVAHIGTPLKGEVCDIEAGMTVVFRKMQKVFLHKIEKEDYIVLSQEQILGQLLDDKVKVS